MRGSGSLWIGTIGCKPPRPTHPPTAEEYTEACKAGSVSCEEYTEQGVEAIGPLYGLPIPMKGSAAVVDYPSGAGVGILSGFTPVKDSALTEMIKARNGIIFGTTNVPEFAASCNTANPASGQTRNPYNHAFAPGGSSGGAASAVAMHMCPVAVSEDTGGSTRVPAMYCGLFGFDPARNHYPNGGNPAMTISKDQFGVVARSINDILFYDRALLQDRHEASALHDAAWKEATSRSATTIKVGTPLHPWCVGKQRQLDQHMKVVYERTKSALRRGGVTIVEASWPSCVPEETGGASRGEWADSNGVKSIQDFADFSSWGCRSFLGQVAHFVYQYLDAPVSLKEIVEDIGEFGYHNPGNQYQPRVMAELSDETSYRYFAGPFIKDLVERYNSLFDAYDLDFILVPAAYNPTPDLAEAFTGTMAAIDAAGDSTHSHIWKSIYPTNEIMKDIHIPKLAVPTGLNDQGRPTGVQVWGRAVSYDDMFEDAPSTEHSIRFLHLAAQLVGTIPEDETLRRVTPKIAQDLFA